MAATYVAEQFEANDALRRYFKTAFLVDEAYIPTLLMNSPLAQRISGVNLTYEQWTPTSGPHPRILTQADFGALLRSPKLFARKFDASLDESVLDMLDDALLRPGECSSAPGAETPLSIQGQRAGTLRAIPLTVQTAR